MKSMTIRLAVVAAGSLVISLSGAALAADTNGSGGAANSFASAGALLGPAQTGQPNQNCANFPSTPGNSSTTPGSAFNPSGKAGTVYAGRQPQNQKNSASVSQYDVACSNQPPK